MHMTGQWHGRYKAMHWYVCMPMALLGIKPCMCIYTYGCKVYSIVRYNIMYVHMPMAGGGWHC